MNAWAAAAADEPLAEPVIVEDRAAYLDEHLPADGATEPGVRCLGIAETARSAAVSGQGCAQAAHPEPLLRRRRNRPHARNLWKTECGCPRMTLCAPMFPRLS